MEELRKKAINYAEENYNKVMKEAFATVYAAGYRDGYNDCQSEKSVNLCNIKTEYVDLGLPSDILWSKDYEKTNGSHIYLPYDDAAKFSIPTESQWDELLKTCRFIWSAKNYNYECVGPNGNYITFSIAGYKIAENEMNSSFAFGTNSETEKLTNKSACLVRVGTTDIKSYLHPVYMGYKLPIRLVRT